MFLLKFTLLLNSENHEHMKNVRNVDCVLANYSKVQQTAKPKTNCRCRLRFRSLAPHWLIPRNTVNNIP